MNFKKLILGTAVALIICASANAAKILPKDTFTVTRADGSSAQVIAEMAVNQEERARGFMERKKIPDGTGMIFVFERDQILRFWMKNTPTPLSIAYITSDGTIADIFDMTPFALSDVSSTRSVRFALEVPQGWFAREGITKGCKVNAANGQSLRTYFKQ